MQVERYEPTIAAEWDAFVRTSRNGTFLLERGYMDYHRDRFADCSLLVHDAEGELIAVLPAHAAGNRAASHDGLSYGGLVIGPNGKAPIVLRALEAMLLHLKQMSITTLDYKSIPHIYHRQPADEDRYALFLLGAQLVRRDLLSVIALGDRLPYQARRVRGIKKAQVAGLTVQAEAEFAEYWAQKWSDLLRNEEKALDKKGVAVFYRWIAAQLATDRPLNEFARDIIAARGSTYANPPANFWRAVRDPLQRSESVAQVFLGIRVGCARCHNHPFDRWTMNDYYGFASFFSQIGYKKAQDPRELTVFNAGEGEMRHPVGNRKVLPKYLGASGPDLHSGQDYRPRWPTG